MLPATLIQKVAGQVILVQALSNDDDGAPLRIVKPRQDHVFKGLVHVIPFN